MNNGGNIIVSEDIDSFPINKTLIFKFKGNVIVFIVNIYCYLCCSLYITKSDILSMSLIDLMLNTISLTGLLKRSLRDAIF